MITINSHLIVNHYLSEQDGSIHLDSQPVIATQEDNKNGGHAKAEIIVRTENFATQQIREGVRVHDVVCVKADNYHAELELIDEYGTPIATFKVSVTDKDDAAVIWIIPTQALVGIHQLALKTHDSEVAQ